MKDVKLIVVPFNAVYDYNGLPFYGAAGDDYIKLINDFGLEFGESKALNYNIVKLSRYVVEKETDLVFMSVEENDTLRAMQRRFVMEKLGWLFSGVKLFTTIDEYLSALQKLYSARLSTEPKKKLGVIPGSPDIADAISSEEFQIIKL